MAKESNTDRPRSALPHVGKAKGIQRSNDITLSWVAKKHPQLEPWRSLAVEWLKGETRSVSSRLNAFVAFLEKYLVLQKLPLSPMEFLSRETILPDFYQCACPQSKVGLSYNNIIHNFLNFVLLREFSALDDYGRPVVSPAYHNPVARMSTSGLPKLDESVRSPLPYGYIDELRRMLAMGPHFRDWVWAQNALGAEVGQSGRVAPDWFPVDESKIDLNDPDCIWRRRTVWNGTRLEMWSPVRWVALLVKLILPLRTLQVRMLDSGEADTSRYQAGIWQLNTHPLAEGSERRPLQQGVFRRSSVSNNNEHDSVVLYINTNKTADTSKSGADKGYLLPWPSGGPQYQDVFYWLEKLRNWQEKYNPISRRTAWTDLDGRHIQAKSAIQLASFPNACFLFRLPETQEGEHHLPIREAGLDFCWFALLEALTARLADRGETHKNGTQIQFLPPLEERTGYPTTLFPLHSLRVSLVTALALEGHVPFPILQKLVGHSRLLMTLYYTKPGATHIRDALVDAAERLEELKDVSIQNFLLDTQHEQLLQQAICNNVAGLSAAIPEHPAARNPAGWMPMHHGLCLVGGNTSEGFGNSSVGGCYNGGPNITSPSMPKYGPVPGGSRNCIRCRWFVTEPHYLPALAAHFNTVAYHFDEARNKCLENEKILQELKKEKVNSEQLDQPFRKLEAFRQAERIWESAMKRFSDLAEDLVACYRLIERCKTALEDQQDEGIKLVATGDSKDVHISFEETDSELLQLAGICESVEIYPDLELGKAVFRRSQLLDAVLYRENLPPMFMYLTEGEQLRAGNAFIRRLAQQINMDNPVLGKREVISLIDAGKQLSDYLGIDIAMLLPTRAPKTNGHIALSGGDL
jgi:hypothetical protein